MKAELKKLLARPQTWIILVLLCISVPVLMLRHVPQDRALFKLFRQAIRTHSSEYSQAAAELQTELDAMDTSDMQPDSAAYQQYVVVTNLLGSKEQFAERDRQVREAMTDFSTQMQATQDAYVRADLQKAYTAYNRAYPYRLCYVIPLSLSLQNTQDRMYCTVFAAAVLCLFCGVFAAEHESGMYQILFSARRGKRFLFRKKVGASLLLLCLVALIYTAELYIFVWLKYGISASMLFSPVQSVPEYAWCPFAISLAEYALLHALGFLLAGSFLLSVTVLCSAVLKSSVQILGVSAVCAVCSAFCSRKLGLLRLMRHGDYLQQYETVNVQNVPVYSILLAVICTVCVSAFLFFAARMLWCRNGGD